MKKDVDGIAGGDYGSRMTTTQSKQIAELIKLREKASETEAAKIQKQIDAIFDPIDAAWEANHLAAIEKNFPHLALLTA